MIRSIRGIAIGRYISLLVVAVALIGCSVHQKPTKAPPEPGPPVIAKYDPESQSVIEMNRELLRTTFEDGTPAEPAIERHAGELFLVRDGDTGENSCHITAHPLDLRPNGDLIPFIISGPTSCRFVCTGVGCGNCRIEIHGPCTGRCVCRTGEGACNFEAIPAHPRDAGDILINPFIFDSPVF